MPATHHRPWDAIKVLGMALHKGYSLRSSLTLEALEAGRKGPRAAQGSLDAQDSMLGHHIRELIQRLQSAQDVDDTERLAALEWAYLRGALTADAMCCHRRYMH